MQTPHDLLPLPDLNACSLLTDGQQECWENLVQNLASQLATAKALLRAETTHCQQLEAERNQLAEELEENRITSQALAEASAAQAQQFSATLKQLRQNQAQIIQSEKMSSLGQLVAGIAHEINNPVNFIYGNLTHAQDYVQDLIHLLQLYQQHYPQPPREIQAETAEIELEFLLEDLPKLLNSMKVGSDRIQKIVLSLRNFSRMDEAEVKEVDIHEGIDSTLMILQNRLKARSDCSTIEIIRDYGKLPLVECYAGQLNQVFMNLLSNAIDALEERFKHPSQLNQLEKTDHQIVTQAPSPTIRIQTQILNSRSVSIRIADNGLGIPETVKERLFDPFFTTKPVGKGTGLGLSISYQIVTERHGGKIYCNSSPGEGTEFVLEIPVKPGTSSLPA